MLDHTDRRIILALDAAPRATVQFLAQSLRLARGTVQTRLERLLGSGVLRAPSAGVVSSALDLPLRAVVTADVDQAQLDQLRSDIAAIAEVVECVAISGDNDMLLQIVARDADHVYEITRRLMQCRGVVRTSTSIVLREIMPYRMAQLLADGGRAARR